MNSGLMKFNQIIGKCGSFSESITTVQQDIIAMVDTASTKRKLDPADDTVTPPPKLPKRNNPPFRKQRPPFAIHHKSTDGTPLKIGDKKKWNGTTFYYCDDKHYFNVEWHTHTAHSCRTRKWFLQRKEERPKPIPAA